MTMTVGMRMKPLGRTDKRIERSATVLMMDELEKTGPRKMLNLQEVLDIVPVGRSTLFRMMQLGHFPRGHFISPNRRFWYADEVELWQGNLPAETKRGRGRRPKS
jgi:prophage regulatory protein